MDLDLTTQQANLQRRMREFIAQNLPEDIASAARFTPTVFPEYGVMKPWHDALYKRGWVATNWPRKFGGTGWSPIEQYLWECECARANTPIISPIGLALVGPVVMHYGSQDQKNHFLPAILSGEDYWCQGFSEPGAGSDLAAVRTRATRDGDNYIVSGSKIWTTHAQYSTRMFALVRTSTQGPRQAGLTVLLMDMRSPGITIRPIKTMGGDHEINEVFINEVKIPVQNRIGEENQGWDIAKFLLAHERGGSIVSPRLRNALNAVRSDLKNLLDSVDKALLEREIASVSIDLDALEMLELRSAHEQEAGRQTSDIAPLLKLRSSQLTQAIAELGVRTLGEESLYWQPDRPNHKMSTLDEKKARLRCALPALLNARAHTIFGGTSEIQKNLIAKSVLER